MQQLAIPSSHRRVVLVVVASQEVVAMQVGSAEAEAFASVEEGGDFFPGSDLRTVQIAQA